MQRYGYRLWIILMVGVLWGCIREKNGQCNSEIVIYVSVDDSALQSRSASGDNGNVDHTKIYIYGADLKLQRIVNYSRYDMDNRTRVRVDFPEGEHPTVVVWGNLNGAQEMAGTDAGEPLSAGLIQMIKRGAYFIPPDHLYYGSRELSDEHVQEVVISSWVGRINITVKGLKDLSDKPDAYYFIIESRYDGYDFYGNPLEGEALIRMEAVPEIREGEELLRHEPVNMIAYPQGDRRHTITVSVYQKSSTGDQLLGIAVTDVEGHKITTQPGKNTNVLIDFNQPVDMNVYIHITEWEEVWEWKEW